MRWVGENLTGVQPPKLCQPAPCLSVLKSNHSECITSSITKMT